MAAAMILLLSAAVGAAAGRVIRHLLAVIPRGMTMTPGWTEAVCAVLTAAGVGLAWGTVRVWPVFFAGLLAVALAPVDWRFHRLPDAITLPAIGIAVFPLAISGWILSDYGALGRAVVTATVVWVLFGVVAWISPRSMGRGDVKLVPTLALLTGFVSVGAAVLAIALAFVLGAVAAAAGLATGRLKLKSAIPFGPCLLAATWLVLAFPAIGRLLDR